MEYECLEQLIRTNSLIKAKHLLIQFHNFEINSKIGVILFKNKRQEILKMYIHMSGCGNCGSGRKNDFFSIYLNFLNVRLEKILKVVRQTSKKLNRIAFKRNCMPLQKCPSCVLYKNSLKLRFARNMHANLLLWRRLTLSIIRFDSDIKRSEVLCIWFGRNL